MKKILFALLIICSGVAEAQIYNNEWIDYSKTYYKFKVIKTGIHRISFNSLSSAGLGNIPAEQFKLWRNGQQVHLYTTKASGSLASGDYIEFWGEMNDGKPDRELYRDPKFQLNDKWSLISDTAVYFLTVDASNNRRLQNTSNNVSGNTLPAEPYFMFTAGNYFKNKLNPGEAYNVVEYLYSSSYDKGEGWTSGDITSNYSMNTGFKEGTLVSSFDNFQMFNGGPAPKFRIAVSGNSFSTRKYTVTINTDPVLSAIVPYMSDSIDSTTLSRSLFTSDNAAITVSTRIECPNPPNCVSSDRMVIHKYELTYPRKFNFGGASNFEFELPANATGNYLEIAGFSYGSTAPVLYDLTNGKRYIVDISAAPLLKIVLEPSATSRKLVLVNQESSNITSVPSLETKNFINYNSPATRGDYLIISNSLLFNDGNSNPVEDYRLYRSSVAGGSHNAKIYLSDELVDQFGFGIKKNPAAIRNFILYTKNVYPQRPKNVFIIGKGVNYVEQRNTELGNNATNISNLDKLNLIPPFGWPASDVLLASEPGKAVAEIPIGRLSVINGKEVSDYLKKIKEYELAQKTAAATVEEKAWMKNVVHIIGTNEAGLDAILSQYMENYRKVIEDTLYGAKVSTFRKTTTTVGDNLTSSDLNKLFKDGISLITYFGHSSSTTLDFNLDDPQNYDNQGKYPIFLGLGCNAGNFFTGNTNRFNQKATISEKYVLAPDRGTIAFIASTHFGIVHYLDIWNSRAYRRIAVTDYGKSIGEIMKHTAEDVFTFTTQEDFFARANAEQTELHGDPAIVLNTHPKPDYVIEDPMVKISPSFISIADPEFFVNVKALNIGKAINKNLIIEVKRQFPDGRTSVVERRTIPGIRYADSIAVKIPINPVNDKGNNKIIVTIDPDNIVDEITESNNSITKEIHIYEDDARPIYPANLTIVNKQNIKLTASTADPFTLSKQYRMELDTTELFNSPSKVTRTISQVGGLLEFDPGINFTNERVYYWRVGLVQSTGAINWNKSSFVYLANSDVGFNQSHLYQHLKSQRDRIILDSTIGWKFQTSFGNLVIKNGVFPSAASLAEDFSIFINGNDYIRSVCGVNGIIVNVIDPKSFKPWFNANGGQPGQYGSDPVCGNNTSTRVWNFQYNLSDVNKRKSLVEFLEMIPAGHYVVVRNIIAPDHQSYVSTWKSDTTTLGSNRSIYHHLLNQGFSEIDSFNRPRSFIFTYQKDAGPDDVNPKYIFSEGVMDKISLSADYPTMDSIGYITSPMVGPVKQWKEMKWDGISLEQPGTDAAVISLIGVKTNGEKIVLRNNITLSERTVNLSSYNASQYPYLQLSMRNADSLNKTPYQLNYWRVTYMPIPEGALAPNITFNKKDTLDIAEPLNFEIAFKNVSDAAFDSVKVKLVVTDKNNVEKPVTFKMAPLPPSQTMNIKYTFDTKQLVGANSFYVVVNPDEDQPEQYHFNNFGQFDFFVNDDRMQPIIDVTFDNIHILNHDIVSSKPNIMIKLKDEAKWFLLNDPSIVNVQVKHPDGVVRSYSFNSDTLKFTPASGAPNTDNTATVNFTPTFLEDGDYELIISGKDMSNNQAGTMQYRVMFQVINKPMISNMLNYPNPFTTSTAFVFTLTGSEVPQNLKIQILTVTGKVVREITKSELGSLRIGRNITEFKWDGTDQFGQKLANGVYLYRVTTNLNGSSLENFKDSKDNTDKFFNKGYGKMYLMR